ncbi:hypothetical protein [Streptomyces sp. NRRL F-4428]|uniref:hypothetical protein n=1 Tax=Streptomyces sp. NRRL F-4428 TaxID=1609137 RepID=UPI0005ED3E5D|nr:hypothetical protein [Streptomyces sp. NRRL F-4428]KJK47857.1 hypothetical protein UK14_19675 [Streptomyces sp. NRRL F-4428]
MLERKRLTGRPHVPFVLPGDSPAAHPCGARGDRAHGDRARAGQVSQPAHNAHPFRYMAAGDYWFDGGHTDHHGRGHS